MTILTAEMTKAILDRLGPPQRLERPPSVVEMIRRVRPFQCQSKRVKRVARRLKLPVKTVRRVVNELWRWQGYDA